MAVGRFRYAAGVQEARHRLTEPFWQKTSAVIVAVGTLVGSLVALFGLLVSQRFFGPTPDDFYIPAPGASPRLLDKTVLWGPTEFRFDRIGHVDLDPATGPDRRGGEADIYTWGGAEMSGSSDIFVWREKAAPTLRNCANFLATHGSDGYFPIGEGMRLCLKTNEGRVALITVKRREGDGWIVDGMVWKERVF